jgi:hypothetical protein
MRPIHIAVMFILTLCFTSAAMAQHSAQCTAPPDKEGQIKCTRDASRGFFLDIVPNRPRVKFELHTYASKIRRSKPTYDIVYLGGDQPYRFNDATTAGTLGTQTFEVWLVECRDHNGIKAKCSDLLTVTPIDNGAY